MQQWEYCVSLDNGIIIYYTLTGQQEDKKFAKNKEKARAFLGEQGWEAFGIFGVTVWAFKRSKPPQQAPGTP